MSHWVAWQDDLHGNEEIFFTEGMDGSWLSSGFDVTQTLTPSLHPSVGKIYRGSLGPFGVGFCGVPALVWEERTSSTSGLIQFWDFTTDFPETLSAVGADPSHASIASFHEPTDPGVVEGTVAAVWTDRRDGNEEIYLAEGETFVVATDVPETSLEAGPLQIGNARIRFAPQRR